MSWNMHVCSVYDIQYEYPGMIGYEAQDALYRIFEMFDVETSAEDIYDEDYEVERIGQIAPSYRRTGRRVPGKREGVS